MQAYKPRTLETGINAANRQFSIILLTGPRQVGKTTLLNRLSTKKREHVSLDDANLRLLAQNDPALFFEQHPPPLFIDEVQYAPQLFPYMKMICDNIGKPGQFWLTGSQQFHLMKNVTESLAGRVAIIHLQGFSAREQHKQAKGAKPFSPATARKATPVPFKNSVFEVIFNGGLPAFTPAMRDLFFNSYTQTYLQRDVRDVLNIGQLDRFTIFLKACAARTGQVVNYTNIARDVEVSPNTIKSWMSVLESSGIIYLLRPFAANTTRRIVKTPKLYFMDTGLCSYLCGWSDATALQQGNMSGAMFETYVITEILKSYWYNLKEPPVYFYRDSDQKEVDLILYENNTITPIEIKSSGVVRKQWCKNFKPLNALKLPVGKGAVVYTGDNVVPVDQTIDAIPLGCI